MDKKKIIVSIAIIMLFFLIVWRFSANRTASVAEEKPREPMKVSVQSAQDSKSFVRENIYPGNVVGDQEIKITAKSAGTVLVAPGEIGTKVGSGALLSKIDDTGSLAVGESGLRSLQVQQAQSALEQAKESYDLAKSTYKNTKSSGSATKIQKNTAKSQKEIAKMQYENLRLGLSGAIDNHIITSPISGIITSKDVSVGDSVSIGQTIATLSKTANVKVQFYVDQDQRNSLVRGQEVLALSPDNKTVLLEIANIAAAADQTTKRFLIEAFPKDRTAAPILSGTILTVTLSHSVQPQDASDLILPLSAVNVGQNESYIYIFEKGVAKKIIVSVKSVNGEAAEISADIAPETLIITDGNKLVQDGETIVLNQ
jgi:RND family efflux transporter MFP subunit